MGTMLALESLRQLYARYGDTVTGRIGAVVFAAPDIDMDVFSSAIGRIGPLAGKITVITSTNDRALALSGRIAGGMTRVGAAEKASIERLGGCRLGHHQPRFVPIGCGGVEGDTPLD
jgi:esterase/lipase superfamily enzyme